jgi:hypothetical protein
MIKLLKQILNEEGQDTRLEEFFLSGTALLGSNICRAYRKTLEHSQCSTVLTASFEGP